MSDKRELTKEDIAEIRKYHSELKRLERKRPKPLSDKQWEDFWGKMLIEGAIPEEYQNRIGVTPNGGYYDIKEEKWIAESVAINEKYHDVAIKAFEYMIQSDPIEWGYYDVKEGKWIAELNTEEREVVGMPVVNLLKEVLKKDPRTAVEIRQAAIEKGALMSLDGHAASFSAEDLKDALNSFTIKSLPDGADPAAAFDGKGMLNTLIIDGNELIKTKTIDAGFFMAMLQAALLSPDDNKDGTINVYLPGFLNDAKIDPRDFSEKRGNEVIPLHELRLKAFMERIMPFDRLVGCTIDGNYYRVATFLSYDRESETVTFSTPYLFAVIEAAEQRANERNHPQYNRLFHSNIANEVKPAAVELANRILSGIERRGIRGDYKTYTAKPQISKKTITQSDGTKVVTEYRTEVQPAVELPEEKKSTVTWRARFSSLIKDCPQLNDALTDIDNSQDYRKYQAYNSKLKQVFEAAYRIIMEKSDAPEKYKDFTISKSKRKVKGKLVEAYDIPTKSTLSRELKITHRGLNTNYVRG